MGIRNTENIYRIFSRTWFSITLSLCRWDKVEHCHVHIWLRRWWRTATSSLPRGSWWLSSLPPTTAGSSTTRAAWWAWMRRSCAPFRYYYLLTALLISIINVLRWAAPFFGGSGSRFPGGGCNCYIKNYLRIYYLTFSHEGSSNTTILDL